MWDSKKIKIVATVGPSSYAPHMLEALAREGVNVFRINFSHENRDHAPTVIKNIRAVERKLGWPLAILGDLMGPKIRTGKNQENISLKTGQFLQIDSRSEEGNEKRISLNFPEMIQYLKKRAHIYLGDGSIKLQVEREGKEKVIAQVIAGGTLRSRMTFAAEGMKLSQFIFTKKDREDMKMLEAAHADMIAVSFIQRAQDIKRVRSFLSNPRRSFIVAKIETAESVKNLDEIIKVSDGIMIARGDLGFSLPLAELPQIQKSMIVRSLFYAKPVITATQMLESMTQNPFPTRAEVTDVANAILDGTDALMLSQETAIGKFPRESVQTMRVIIKETEKLVAPRILREGEEIPDAVAASVVDTASHIGAKLIIAFTESGATARRIARHKPSVPLIALSPRKETVHHLSLSYNTFPLITSNIKNVDALLKCAHAVAAKNPVVVLKKGDAFVVSAGIPFGESGSTNLILSERLR